jgi:hypothetical protein
LVHRRVAGVVIGIYCSNRFARRNLFGFDGRKLVYVLLVLASGGAHRQWLLKENFGRARHQGLVNSADQTLHFTPSFSSASECTPTIALLGRSNAAGAFLRPCIRPALEPEARAGRVVMDTRLVSPPGSHRVRTGSRYCLYNSSSA